MFWLAHALGIPLWIPVVEPKPSAGFVQTHQNGNAALLGWQPLAAAALTDRVEPLVAELFLQPQMNAGQTALLERLLPLFDQTPLDAVALAPVWQRHLVEPQINQALPPVA